MSATVLPQVPERRRAAFFGWLCFPGGRVFTAAAPSSLANRLAAGSAPAGLSACRFTIHSPEFTMQEPQEGRRTLRSVADLQFAARHDDAERYTFLARKLERAGQKTAAEMARRWAMQHRRVAATLMHLGGE